MLILHKLIILSGKSGNEKLEYLCHNLDLKTVLKYAYDPHKKFYLSAPRTEGCDDGSELFNQKGEMEIEAQFIFDALSERKLSGNVAIKRVCDYISFLNKNSALIFNMILDKDLRIGLGVKSINKVFPGLIKLTEDGSKKPSVMLCKTFNSKTAKYPLFAGIKKDGVRGRIQNIRMQTRSGYFIKGIEHIEKELEQYDFEKDGEVVVPGLGFDVASGLIRNHQGLPEAVYYMFDVPSHKGNKLQRYEFMIKNIKETDSVKIVEHRLCEDESELMSFYKYALDCGEEGLVVYTIDHKYEDKRTKNWCRMVPDITVDSAVVGFEEGKGKFKNSLGGLIILNEGKEVKVGTGYNEKPWSELSDSEKRAAGRKNKGGNEVDYEERRRGHIWLNQSLFFGRIAEIECKEITKTGSLRQPRFKCWRQDKGEINV